MTLISAKEKLVEASLKVKFNFAESPPCRLDLLLETEIVGIWVSKSKVSKLFVFDPSALELPAASVKTAFATLTTPLPVLLAAGVNKVV